MKVVGPSMPLCKFIKHSLEFYNNTFNTRNGLHIRDIK
jgi:hypothetical protein